MFNQYGLLMKSNRSGTPRTIKDPGLGKFLYDLYIECGADLTEELNGWCLDGSDSSSYFYMAFDYGRKSYIGKAQHVLPTYGIRGTDAAGKKYVNQYFQKYEDIMGGAFVDYIFGTDYINQEELSKYNLENETVERMRQKLWGVSHVVEKPDLICRIMERIWAAKKNDPAVRILLILENAEEESLNFLRQLYLLMPQGLRVLNGFQTNIRRKDLDVISRDELPVSIVTVDKTNAAGFDKNYLKKLRFPVEIIKVDAADTYDCDMEKVAQLKHHCERMSVVTERYLNYAEWAAMDQAGLAQSSFSIYGRIWEIREELYSGKNQEAGSFTGLPGEKMDKDGQKSSEKQGDRFEILVPKREMDELNEKYISMKRGRTRAAATRNVLGILAALFAAAGVVMAVVFGIRIRMLQDNYTEQEKKLQSQEAEVKDLSRQLGEKESEAEDLSQQLENHKSEAESLSEQLDQKKSEAEDLSKQLKNQKLETTNYSEIAQQLEEKESEAESLSRQLEEKESEAESLSRQLEDSRSEAAGLSQQLEGRESEAQSLSQQLEDSKAEAESLSRQLEDSRSEAKSLSRQLEDSKSEAAGLSQQLEAERSKNEELSAETEPFADVQAAGERNEEPVTEAGAEDQPETEMVPEPQTEPYIPLGILY